MISLANRFQGICSNLIERTHQQQKFLFRYTTPATQRIKASFVAFVEGLFGEKAYEHIELPPPLVEDTLLSPYRFCKSYRIREKTGGLEGKRFLKTEIVTRLVNDVSLRLGFQQPLPFKQIKDMFDMCRYDQAWYVNETSAWCMVSVCPVRIC